MPPNMSRSVKFQFSSEEHAAQETSLTNSAMHPKASMAKPPRPSLKPSSLVKTHYIMAAAKSYLPSYSPPPPEEDNDDNSILEETADEVLGLGMDSSEEEEEETSSVESESSESWRKYGKMYRAQLVLLDEEKGGNTFVLSNNCTIERYYRVAERVLEQFISTGIKEPHELTESYLVGNRLVKFLSVVLPTHVEYFSPDPRLTEQRHRSQAHLVELLQYKEELALLMDEIQYNKYILQDLTPEENTYFSELTANTANDTTLTLTSDDEGDKENYKEFTDTSNNTMEQKVAAVVATQERKEDDTRQYRQRVRSPPPPRQDNVWEASFSEMEGKPKSRIDLLLSEEPSPCKKAIPKIKQPPAVLPRSLRAKAKSTHPPPPSNYSPPRDPWNLEGKGSSPQDSWNLAEMFSSPRDPWNLEEKKSEELFPTRIEERLNQARLGTLEPLQLEEWNPLGVDQYDEGYLIAGSSQKRLLQHFKGCVRCLLE